MCLSLVFIGVWLRPDARLFMTASVLGVRTALLCLQQLKYLYSTGKVEFKVAAASNSWASRLGYKWKHFLQTALQDLFHSELWTAPHAVGLSFQLCFSPPLPQTVDLMSLFFYFCLTLINQAHLPFPFWIRSEIKRNGCRLMSTSLQHHDHCLAEWRGPAGQQHYPPPIYGGRERRWMPSLAPSLTLRTQQWEQRAAGPLLCLNTIAVATELINPTFSAAFVRKDKEDTSCTDSAHKL